MSTKPPSPVEEFSSETLERIAYTVAAGIEAREPNDGNRLGYNVWIWLKDRKGSLEQAVRAAGARTNLDDKQLVETIKKRLQEQGIKVA